MIKIKLFVLFSLCGFLVACQTTVKTSIPETFAEDRDVKVKGVLLGAIEPQGTVFRVRRVKPKQEGNFKFWKEALAKHLVDSGYVKVSEKDIVVSGRTGQQIEYNVPVGNKDYTYQVSILPSKEDLLVVEASGERKRFSFLRPKIDQAIQKIEIKN